MNMHVPRILTAGEKALVAAMETAAPALPGNAAVAERRMIARARMQADGLPTRKVEAWHYTDMRTLLRGLPQAGPAVDAAALVDGATVLAATDAGVSVLANVPGASIASMAPAFATGAAAALMPAGDRADVVGLVSTALTSTGFDLAIADGTTLEAPLQMDFGSSAHLHALNRVTVGAGASGVLIERSHGAGLSSLVTHLTVADGADVTYVILQEKADDALHLARIVISLGAKAKLMLVLVNTGGGLVRQEIDVAVAGEHSDFRLRGMNLLSGKRHVDVTMTVLHSVEHTSSTEFIRNVATGEAKGVFQGQIRVAAQAQKTDARMACNTLILSDEAEFLAKPELEIFADDVACGHGATVAEINRDHLFYLMARGVSAAEARAMLVRAFVSELLDEIENEPLHDALQGRLTDWLMAH
ncbi:MAG: Fe-S cluster assembly protein SufD [Phyllobacteriaceae bacterium]|nr:Fe-S cluster assembly protein SufD [Phyllobacteriaceae bacterium]